MSPVCKMADNGPVDCRSKCESCIILYRNKECSSDSETFRAHFGTRWAPCKQTIYRLSSGTVFQPMRINSVPDVKCFCNNKNVLCIQSMV